MIIAQVLESGVGVHAGEATVHHADAEAFAVDAFVYEMLSTEAFQLVGEGVFVIASVAKQSTLVNSGLPRRSA